jgi:hypothetical protein
MPKGTDPETRTLRRVLRARSRLRELRLRLAGYAQDPRAWRLTSIDAAAVALAEALAAVIDLGPDESDEGG